MSKPRYADEAAFPRDAVRFSSPEERDNTLLPTQWGLTKREYFAAMAMQGLAPHYAQGGNSMAKNVARLAVENADALLAELAK